MNVTCVEYKSVEELLRGYDFLIPRFQRPYSWDRENVEEFWRDAQASASEHFIGSMVVFKHDKRTRGVTDGQQRLTTLVMILSALRRRLDELGASKQAGGLQALIERPDLNNRTTFALKTELPYPFLQNAILSRTPVGTPVVTSPEETRLAEAYSYLLEEVANVGPAPTRHPGPAGAGSDTDAVVRNIEELRDRILNIRAIYVELDNDDDAYFIFETLNTRGKDLRVSDLLKNHLLKLLRPANTELDGAKDRWAVIVKLLEKSGAGLSLDSFLLHYWLSKYDYTSAKKLFKSMKRHITHENADEFLDTLCEEARAYRAINEPDSVPWSKHEKEIEQSLAALALFRVKQALPMVMAIMRAYRGGKLKTKTAKAALRAIENFHFMFTAITSQRSSGGISSMYASHARSLDRAATTTTARKAVDALKGKLKPRLPSYEEFEANFVEKGFSRGYTKDKDLVKYVLARIDGHYATKGLVVEYDQMTIEHIAPEKAQRGSVQLPEEVVGQIGNLLLVDSATNVKLGNRPLAQKLRVLRENSRVWLDDKLKELEDDSPWGKPQIEERTKSLAKLAYDEVWRL